MNMINRAVVVTGVGAATPLGGDARSTWEGLLAGRSGVRLLTYDWAERSEVRIAAEAAVDPGRSLSGGTPPMALDRTTAFALAAAREAWADAGFAGPAGTGAGIDPGRLGTVVASGIGGTTALLSSYEMLKRLGPGAVSPDTVAFMLPNTPSTAVGLEVNARAGVHTPVSACASGAEAVGYAMEMIRTGRADVVLAGGAEAAICELHLAAFGNMKAMSRRNDDPAAASRPYDTGRDGFVMGEGAGVVVLEAYEHATRRGARVYAEVVGQGLSADGHHIAQPEPTGRGIAAALTHLLEGTDIKPVDIVHANAHATSTPMGDVAELRAMRQVFGDDLAHIAVSATKSMTGHLLGGAGGVETVAAVLALRDRLAPPTLNLDRPDPAVDADIVRGEARPLPGGRVVALNNSFGFGGHNVVLAFRSV
ncbi:3-oxoacyl-[acyl-carrier-protein] synthase 2 [Streptomyces sp. enrichment culture]|uniref:beta-ketoacyl-[acyl-carrier-protein] synthase family protein n=1 Tax=Streptomyces sp. enrichment culture TaxID=1795815 RepID=UPI003F566254